MSRKICPIKVKSSADNKLTRSARKPDRIRHEFYLQSADQEDNLIDCTRYGTRENREGKNAVKDRILRMAESSHLRLTEEEINQKKTLQREEEKENRRNLTVTKGYDSNSGSGC